MRQQSGGATASETDANVTGLGTDRRPAAEVIGKVAMQTAPASKRDAMPHQPPILHLIDGGADTPSPAEWDAQAEFEIGTVIAEYLTEHPPPERSQVAADLHRWASDLRADGRARLEEAARRGERAV